MTHRILLVEDEEHLSDVIKLNLDLEGYDVTTVTDGKKALEAFRNKRFNLVILDVMLPEIDGFRVCETIRLGNSHPAIFFLTAKNSSHDKVYGLKLGADDYLVKPFNLEELLLRIRNLLRRSDNKINSSLNFYKFDGSEINFSTYEITDVNGNKRKLAKRESMLLKLLIERKNEVVS